jgi:hypothetical protein
MGDEYRENDNYNYDPHTHEQKDGFQGSSDDLDKRIEDIKRLVVQGANEAQQRIKRVVDRAGGYWQQSQTAPMPHQPSSVEEHRIRQLANMWSNQNWRVARELGTYMEVRSLRTDEVWETTLETRWETRTMEILNEPYQGRNVGMPRPLLPVWDYQLPDVVGLKAPLTRTRLHDLDEVVSCTNCNSTGHVLCSNCNGRGWIVCPECKGRTKKRCTTCRGRGYISDVAPNGEKKPFFQRQADTLMRSVSGKFSDALDGIRQQGVPVPNPMDTDPASKGPVIPCPDCVKGEMPCTCGNGKRVCDVCEGARMALCNNCAGTGKLVRHREIVRSFDLRTQARIVGESVIPSQYLEKSHGDLVYSAEITEPLYADAPPDEVPNDVWRSAVEMINAEQRQDKPGIDPQTQSRPTLQVVELVRIPYTVVDYHYADQDYTLYIYDNEGQEKFYAESYPVRWDRIDRLFKAISNDLLTPAPGAAPGAPGTPPSPEESNRGYKAERTTGGYRVPIEFSPYEPEEEEGEKKPEKPDDNQGFNGNDYRYR